MNRVKKGGVLHLQETARIVVQDWNRGLIKYYRLPPTRELQQTIVVREDNVFDHLLQPAAEV